MRYSRPVRLIPKGIVCASGVLKSYANVRALYVRDRLTLDVLPAEACDEAV